MSTSPAVTDRAVPAGMPARRALRAAEEAGRRLGHDNLGFLSESHGFMPRQPPSLRLPPTHEAWDTTAAQLPELFRRLSLRRTLEHMPVLSAAEEDLPDSDLLRASTIIGIFAHAYFYADPDPSPGTPASVQEPWRQISRRLGQPAPHLSFTDLNAYNWRLIDPSKPDAVVVENLRLLVPILGNEAERRFQMAPVEMLARFTPIVGATARAQEAVAADDPDALERELGLIIETVEQLTFDSFAKVDPNPYSDHYVDPVVWGKTVAPLATPFQEDPPPGPSGTAIPAFQLLDSLFRRRAFATSVGVETARVRRWFPAHWRDFLDAADAVAISDFVARSSRRSLRGTFQEAVDAYAGEAGLLGRHRLKVFGYLDLSFKAGRSKTLGGFGGGFADRLWDRMDTELDLARLERYPSTSQTCHYARVERAQRIEGIAGAAPGDDDWVGEVALDVAGTGLRYRAGSRCEVLPENDASLVERTLLALRADGDEPVQLNAVWQEAVKLRDGYEQARVLSLRSLLTFGRIRPVSRPVAKALLSLSQSGRLRRIVEARAEDQWELGELLEALAETGFKAAQLWKAHPGEHNSICWLVPPETFRMFSISSAMSDDAAGGAERIDLTVRRLRYQVDPADGHAGGARFGTGSSFLCRQAAAGAGTPTRRVSVRVRPPVRFGVPDDHRQPVVMFAGGTGLSPFVGMLAERAVEPEGGDNWLFLSSRAQADLPRRAELARLVEGGRLNLRIAFSRDQFRGRSEGGPSGPQLRFEPGPAQHIGDEMLREENAGRLWELLRERDDGGLGACFYVCGSTGFASSVTEAIMAILHRYGAGGDTDAHQWARQFFLHLVGTGRYRQEIFTTYTGAMATRPVWFDASEIVGHNDDSHGLWMAIDGRVYDVGDFAGEHPGGPKILRSYAGMDATDAYRRARHDVNPEVDAMLGMHEIGVVRRLDFGAASGVALSPTGMRMVTVKDAYRAWIELLYLTVEIENAVGNDYAVQHEPVTHDERPDALRASPYKVRLLVQAHRRFVHEYLPLLVGERLEHLWMVTSAIDSEHRHAYHMRRAVRVATAGAGAAGEIDALVARRLGEKGAADPDVLQWCASTCAGTEAADRWILHTLKDALRSGIQVFERHERDTFSRGAGQLVEAAMAVPAALARYWDLVAGSSRSGDELA